MKPFKQFITEAKSAKLDGQIKDLKKLEKEFDKNDSEENERKLIKLRSEIVSKIKSDISSLKKLEKAASAKFRKDDTEENEDYLNDIGDKISDLEYTLNQVELR